MRICKIKATKRVIEMQSDATPGTLLKNAINAGYDPTEVEEIEVDQAGYEAAKLEDPVEIANAQAQQAAAAVEAAKAQAIVDNLPSWAAIEAAINAADTIPKLRAIVLKIARVEYWLAKNKAD